MSDEQNKSRINIEDLPQAEQELTPVEAEGVQGGGITGPDFQFQAGGGAASTGDVNKDGLSDVIVGTGGSSAHVK